MTDPDQGARAQTDEQRARAVREQLKSVHAFDLAYEMAVSLVSFGYQKMGLTDETSELRDLDDARLAIELLRAVTHALDGQKTGAPTADLHATLAQMQLSYARAVEAVPAAGSAESPTGTPAGESAPKKPAAEDVAPTKPSAEDVAPKKAAAGKPVRKKAAAKKPVHKKPTSRKAPPRKPGGGAPSSAG